jgi:hypothetical protein
MIFGALEYSLSFYSGTQIHLPFGIKIIFTNYSKGVKCLDNVQMLILRFEEPANAYQIVCVRIINS